MTGPCGLDCPGHRLAQNCDALIFCLINRGEMGVTLFFLCVGAGYMGSDAAGVGRI